MKKKFTSKLKEKELLPLTLYYLEEAAPSNGSHVIKMEKARKINASAYELLNFYKAISKF
ncbi:hypothetical protein CLV59_101773 [Chitinophaga dinghuensis]|uniref:Uncharacterized protein n=1 Tax=Chitinophaga dinghuensis TaxID=1539050 RepID=A0A327WCY9_9BACT|nr:hypothetical protein [Chitinophaga dinghuensis]RAJ88008.1 hypothetical protein CLV59_101773 [Chitinophaga dinghuensis]